jgi:RNA polymerase sigma factor (sigma-70 family)
MPGPEALVLLELMMLVTAAAIRTPLRVVGGEVDDQTLIDAVARGDTSSAGELYDRLQPLVRRTVRRLSSQVSDHDDLVQQSFVELLLSLKARPTIRSLEGWAATVAARTVYQRMRREKLEKRFAAPAVDDQMSELPASAPGPQTVTEQRDVVRRISTHLEGVNEKRAQVYVLHDVHGFELKEIAEILNITVANAQSRLVRGRSDLRERLGRDPELSNFLTSGDHP